MARPAITRVEIRDQDGALTNRIPMGSGLSVTVDVEGLRVPRQFVAVSLTTETDLCLVQVNTNMKPLEVFDRNAAQTSVTLTIPHLPLNPGRYWLELRVSEGGVLGVKSLVDKIERAAPIEVVPADVFGTGFQPQSGRWRALCIVNPSWEVRNGTGVVAATAPVDGPDARAPPHRRGRMSDFVSGAGDPGWAEGYRVGFRPCSYDARRVQPAGPGPPAVPAPGRSGGAGGHRAARRDRHLRRGRLPEGLRQG